ncbi:hypothetical protein GALL_411340 [mine drainage metagenome]|uniref:Uncharacterized protein n=1 Tax=mine drainage metagenome TaxID=410659 RepID=A0A1J5QB18_9ZZZZ
MLIAVRDIGAEGLQMIGVDQCLFDDILHLFHGGGRTAVAMTDDLEDAGSQQLSLVGVELATCCAGPCQGRGNAVCVKGLIMAIPFHDAQGQKGFRQCIR